MNKSGPIIIIEDDLDDQFMLKEAFKILDYPNEVFYFSEGIQVLDFLNITEEMPFLILSDINMPKLDGFELREKLHVKPHLKCVPYLFFSTSVHHRMIIDAYSLSVQGFFLKKTSFGELVRTISVIVEYWKLCTVPNNL